MARVDYPCPICIADGVDDTEATESVQYSADSKFDVNGRKTGRCLRFGHHPHGGAVVFFLDNGELVRRVDPSPVEWLLNQAPDPPTAWGVDQESLIQCGVRGLTRHVADKFREKFPEQGKKLPTLKAVADAEANGYPILIHPLYDETDITGIEVRTDRPKTSARPGEYGPTSNGKIIKTVGESGIFITNPFPLQTPEIVLIFEGAKDALIAFSDTREESLDSTVFAGCSASFRTDKVAKTLGTRFPGATLIVVGDRDKAGNQFNLKMIRLGAIPQSLKGCSGKDLGDEENQYLRIQAVKQAIADGVAEWRRRQDISPVDMTVMGILQHEGLAKLDDKGIPHAIPRPQALARILELDLQYGSNLRRNVMGLRDYLSDVEIRDEHVVQIQNDLDKRYGATWGMDQLERQIALRCSQNEFHPVQEYFNALPKWDGKNRYLWILQEILGADTSPLNQSFLACFFRAAAARVLGKEVKHDVMFVLKSARQGVRKTSFFNCCVVNIPGAFVEGHEDILSKDGLLIMHRAWIVELGEVDRITTKKDAEILKNFLSRRVDPIRPPYGRRTIDMPRSFVVVGTTNQGAFLMDSTGHRRFHVIETGDKPFDLNLFRTQIDQVWAQALAEYNQGLPWWLDSKMEELHKTKMEVFQAEEPWTVIIEKVLTEIKRERNRVKELLCEGVTVAEILEKMGIRAESQNRGQANRAAEILRNMGWWRMENQIRKEGKRLRLWFPPQHEMLDEMDESGDESARNADIKAAYSMSH